MRKFLLALLLILVPVQAHATFNFYRSITTDHTKVPSNQTDFPVLVSVTHNDLRTVGDGGHVQNASGFDIRPYSDTACTSALTYKLERYTSSGAGGVLVMFVKIGTLSSSVDDVFYLCYGDSGLSSDGSSTSTWDSSFKTIYMMNENAANTTVSDVTSNSNTGTATRNTSNWTTTGKIGLGFTFAAASTDHIDTFSAIPSSAAFTINTWVNIGSTNSGYRTIYGANGNGPGLWLVDRLIAWFDGNENPSADLVDGATTIATGAWHMVTVTHNGNGTNILVYYDGTLDGTSGSTSNTSLPTGASTGVAGHSTIEPYDGSMDMFTISDTARSADWITTTFNNQNDPGTFSAMGSEQTPGGGGAVKRNLLLMGVPYQ